MTAYRGQEQAKLIPCGGCGTFIDPSKATYALDKLKKSPTVMSDDPLKALAARLGPAPFRAFAVGPFEGELARGARGLLAGAGQRHPVVE